MREFDPSVSSHPVTRPRIVVNLCAEALHFTGVSCFWISLQAPKIGNLGEISRKSPARARNTPVFGRLRVETFLIGTAWWGRQMICALRGGLDSIAATCTCANGEKWK